MKIKIQIKSIYGGILFEYENEENTILKTLLEAIKSRANLYGANLSGANLSGANLSRANLYGANLSGANLSRANLSGANLSGANLSRADLLDASIQPHCTWQVVIKNDLIKIGCKEKTIKEWDLWFSGSEEYSTKRGTKEFAKIQANYESTKAYVLFMKKFQENENPNP